MHPRDRFLKTLRGEKVDRVALHLEAMDVPSREALAAIQDPRYREVAERVFDQHHCRVGQGTYLNRYFCTPPQFIRVAKKETKPNGDVITTTEFDTPKGTLTAATGTNPMSNTVWTLKYPCESLEDIDKLRSVQWELPEGLKPAKFEDVPPEADRRGVRASGVSSPFVAVAGAMSFEHFLELTITEPELVRELTEMCLERTLAALDVLFAGEPVEYMLMGGCEWLTPPMGSPATYETLVQPYEKAIIDRCHQAGAVVHIHCHGRIRDVLELKIARGADYTEPVEPPPDGDITMAEAKALAAGRISLGGNVEARVLDTEDAEAVEAATRAAFEGGNFRMALRQTSSPLTTWTEQQRLNYHRMLDVWEELGVND